MPIHCVTKIPRENTLKRNRNATPLHSKIHGVLFKVINRENGPSSCSRNVCGINKTMFEMISIEKEAHPYHDNVSTAYVNVSYWLRFRHF